MVTKELNEELNKRRLGSFERRKGREGCACSKKDAVIENVNILQILGTRGQ
jgi:hypothetical protein